MGIVTRNRNTNDIKDSDAREWLDQSGCFLFGKYKGELAEDIADTDPRYIRWIIDSIEDISEEDRELLQQYLSWRGRGRKG